MLDVQGARATIILDVDNEVNSEAAYAETFSFLAQHLTSILAQLLADLHLLERTLTVVLCDDATIQRLNIDHRQVDAPTDVLSYPLHEPDDVDMPTVPHLGDVFISLDTAQMQADAAKHSLLVEVAILAAHGLTHLLGYDHPDEAAWQPFLQHQARALFLANQAEES